MNHTGPLNLDHSNQSSETSKKVPFIEKKVQELAHFREKFLEWMGQHSRQFESIKMFNEHTTQRIEQLEQRIVMLEKKLAERPS